jgi:hypothetical protein
MTYIRKDVKNFTDWDSLITGVRTMMGRPETKRTSWYYQAAIHGTSDVDNDLHIFNTCQHGSYFFLAWHRMYLYWFERILRQASGNPNLALPYWNYSSPNERQLPLPFVNPNDSSNPLYTPLREGGLNQPDAGRAALPDGAVSYDAAFCFSNFTAPEGSCASFGGQYIDGIVQDASPPYGALEASPHQQIHTYIGGLMGTVVTAAQDPIFWMHHANIDRLWELWLAQGGGRSNPTTDCQWMNQKFNFVDEGGNPVTICPKDVLDIGNQLHYQYDPPADPVPAPIPSTGGCVCPSSDSPDTTRQKHIIITSNKRLMLRDDPIQMTFEVKASDLDKVIHSGGRRELLLELDELVLAQPSVNYEIYVNPPHDERWNFRNRSYVGTLGFFGDGHHHHGGKEDKNGKRPLSVSYDLTPALLRVTGNQAADTRMLTIAMAPLRLVSPGDPTRVIPAKGGIDIGRLKLMVVTY